VQEEIRFAICPELIASLFVCPDAQTNEEAILLLGAKQYCKYKGYMFSLKYDGHYEDNTKWCVFLFFPIALSLIVCFEADAD
jgi:hypothetical protein